MKLKDFEGAAVLTLIVGAIIGCVVGWQLSGGTRGAARPSLVERGATDREPVRKTALGASCGVELWAKKTLTDSRASAVNLSPQPSSVAALNALPTSAGNTSRDPAELKTYRVTATLTEYKQEGDSDIHLVLNEGGATMVAEIPDPACAAGSRVFKQISTARGVFESTHAISGSFVTVNQTVTVTGVGFYDRPHGQTGASKNNIELHPVVAFAVGSSPSPPPPPGPVPPPPPPSPTPYNPNWPGCHRWPHRIWYHHMAHRFCRSYYFRTQF